MLFFRARLKFLRGGACAAMLHTEVRDTFYEMRFLRLVQVIFSILM